MHDFDPHAEVTDDDVQHAADQADGQDDGLAAMPNTSLGHVVRALDAGRLTTEEALLAALVILAEPSVLPPGPADVAALALRLGVRLVGAVGRLARLFG